MTQYARCNFDGKPIHPHDQWVIETMRIWLGMDNEERRECVRLDPQWRLFVLGRLG